MSIKIDGRTDKERIYKEDGSKVIVIPSLYLNEKEITASGGGGTSTETSVEISECENYAASKYSGADKVIVNVKTWTRVEPTSGYYEINANDEYPVSQFNGYKGICVTKEKEEEKDVFLITQNGWYEKAEYQDYKTISVQVTDYTYRGSHSGVNYYRHSKNNSSFIVNSIKEEGILIGVPKDEAKFSADEKTVSGVADGTSNIASWEFTTPTGSNLEDYSNISWEINGTVTDGVLYPEDSQNIEDASQLKIQPSFTLNNVNTTTEIPLLNEKGYDTKLIVYANAVYASAKTFRISLNLENIEDYTFGGEVKVSGELTMTPRRATSATPTTLSLRQSEVDTTITTYENLVVNNDALIQGDLNVDGYINDFKWYWDEIALENPNSIIGHGLLARLSQCSFTINDSLINIPELQLSPGAIYTTDTYTIQWAADGRLLVDQNIGNFTGTVKILRYE